MCLNLAYATQNPETRWDKSSPSKNVQLKSTKFSCHISYRAWNKDSLLWSKIHWNNRYNGWQQEKLQNRCKNRREILGKRFSNSAGIFVTDFLDEIKYNECKALRCNFDQISLQRQGEGAMCLRKVNSAAEPSSTAQLVKGAVNRHGTQLSRI